MSENKKFILSKEPFIRKADHNENTTVMMRDFMIALFPLIIFAWVKNGLIPYLNDATNFFGMLYPLLLVLVGGLSAFLFEFLWYKFLIKKEDVKISLSKSYPLIPGILLGMIVPLATPLWLVVIGVFFATVIGKLLFGGFGNNIFNPALIGYLFLTYAYFNVITGDNALIGASGFFNAKEVADAITTATPMTIFANDRAGAVNQILEKYTLWDMFLGMKPGSLAETSVLLCLISLVYLIVRKTINWRIPVIYLGTVFVLTYIIGAFNGYAGTLNYALFGLLNGGLVFGAVFMATEPVTSPRTPNGKIIYAFGLGVLTILFRFASSMPEGVATSILIMNMFTALIERVSAKLRVEPNKIKVALNYVVIGLLFSGISVFAVAKNVPTEVVKPAIDVEVSAYEQDFDTLNFKYTLNIDGEEVIVETDQSYKILNISNPEFKANEYKDAISEAISKKKMTLYILEHLETDDEIILYVNTKGFAVNMTATITFNNDFEMTSYSVDTSNESYQHYGDWNGKHPDEEVPNQIIENQTDLDQVQVVTGATITSNALVDAARLALDYVEYLENLTTIKLVNSYQNLENFNFVYLFRNADGKFKVEADQDGNLLTTVNEDIKAEVEEAVSENLLAEYIVGAGTEANSIVVKTKGYGNNPALESTITYDPDTLKITGFKTNTESETYQYSQSWTGEEPGQVMPNLIVAGQDDLDGVDTVTGATVTSKSLIRAAKLALEYLAYLGGNNE